MLQQRFQVFRNLQAIFPEEFLINENRSKLYEFCSSKCSRNLLVASADLWHSLSAYVPNIRG